MVNTQLLQPLPFIHFLDGFLLGKNRDLTPEETQIIKDKLNSCFNKVTPNVAIKFGPEVEANIKNTLKKVSQEESIFIC